MAQDTNLKAGQVVEILKDLHDIWWDYRGRGKSNPYALAVAIAECKEIWGEDPAFLYCCEAFMASCGNMKL